jgi:hypothetical protein
MWTPTPSNRESYKTTREAAMAAFAKSSAAGKHL